MPSPQDDVIERPLPPHKSWRELPPTPPLGVPLPPPPTTQTFVVDEDPPTQPVAAPPSGKRGRRVRSPRASARSSARPQSLVCSRSRTVTTATPARVRPPRPQRSRAAARRRTRPKSVQSVVKQVAPAVVEIQHDGGVGSGVIYDKSGLILTAHHVVAGTDTVTVKTADGQTLDGTVVGRDAAKDLAIVAVKSDKDLPAAESRGARQCGDRRVGDRAGQPVRLLGLGHVGHHQRPRPQPPDRQHHAHRSHPDRCPDQPGQLGRSARRRRREGHRHQHRDRVEGGGSNGVGFAIPVETAQTLMDQVKAAGGVDAPAVQDDSSSSNPLSQVPGLGQIPGLDQLPNDLSQIPGLDQIPGLGAPAERRSEPGLAAAARRAARQRPHRAEPRPGWPGHDPRPRQSAAATSSRSSDSSRSARFPRVTPRSATRSPPRSSGSGLQGTQTMVLRGRAARHHRRRGGPQRPVEVRRHERRRRADRRPRREGDHRRRRVVSTTTCS